MTSALIPVRNGARWLDGAIFSLFEQTSAIDEIVVSIDTATDDDTRDVLSAWPDVTIVTGGLGLAQTFNRGLEACRGDLILWQDADDLSMPVRHELLLEARADQRVETIIGSRCSFINEDGGAYEDDWTRMVRSDFDPVIRSADIADLLPRRCCIFPPTLLFPRLVLDRAAGLDESPTIRRPGYHLLRRLAGIVPFIKVPSDLYAYRQHKGQMTRGGV